MRNRQYSVKVYEIEVLDEEKFISFFEKNHILLKEHLILLKGDISNKVINFLESLSMKFIINADFSKQNKKEKEIKKEKNNILNQNIDKIILEQQREEIYRKSKNNLTVINYIIRSGQEMRIDGDFITFNRINSGAIVEVDGNFISTNLIEGSIICHGNFMLISASLKSNIIFHNVELNHNVLDNRLNKIEFKDNEIIITPILEKEINWGL